jgi:hypothetical protein
MLKAGAEEIVFKVDSHAKPGATPILGRLLRFQPGRSGRHCPAWDGYAAATRSSRS